MDVRRRDAVSLHRQLRPRSPRPRLAHCCPLRRGLLTELARTAGRIVAFCRVTERHGTWLSLDDRATLEAARPDPVGFVSGRSGIVGIDEAQRVPELLLAIKAEVDRDRRPARFLLTGSTRLLGAPGLADSLAGRMESLTLWPFTQLELEERMAGSGLIERAFGGGLNGVRAAPVTRADLMARARGGGYLPRARAHTTTPHRLVQQLRRGSDRS